MTRAKEKLFLIANNCTSESKIFEFIYDFELKDYTASSFTKKEIEKAKQHYKFIGNGKLFRQKEKEKEAKIQEDIAKGIAEVKEINSNPSDEFNINEKEIIVNMDEKNLNSVKDDREENVNKASLFENDSMTISDDIVDKVVKPILNKNKIKFIDNRAKKGAFWIVGGLEHQNIIRIFSKHGLIFIYVKNGGRATERKPSWYLKG